jgi:adenosine deaminase
MLFGNSLNDEYVALGTEGGLTRAELLQIAQNGFSSADLSNETKQRYLEQLPLGVMP